MTSLNGARKWRLTAKENSIASCEVLDKKHRITVQGIFIGIIIKASGASLKVTDLLFAFASSVKNKAIKETNQRGTTKCVCNIVFRFLYRSVEHAISSVVSSFQSDNIYMDLRLLCCTRSAFPFERH